MKRIPVVLMVSAALGGVFVAACVTQSVASPTRAPSSSPASLKPQVAQEPNPMALAKKHVTEKNYLRQLERLEAEIAAAEGLLQTQRSQ